MRKLCIAVILFSFLGYAPLNSFFHNGFKSEMDSVIQKIKYSDGLSEVTKKKVEDFLINADKSVEELAALAPVLLKEAINLFKSG
ncbi:hypothetical protein ACIFOT_02760 [Neobacillus sp. NRS-1170]|uniref:hypothetical protein n=1 Tax=Neobacillus sp. NRS-1170 TaxID=3233898 RepID=UPI003D2D1179